MELNEYQTATSATAIYPEKGKRTGSAINYTIIGLVGESGELANVWKKALRDGDYVAAREKMRYELGDVLWYVARIALELGMTLEEVAQCNLDKLADRKSRNAIRGSGDKR